jgi:cytochrome c oxidase subunit 4
MADHGHGSGGHSTHHPAEARAAMARHEAAVEHSGPHASDKVYVLVAVVLAVITAVETWTFFEPGIPYGVLVPLLLVLSAVKFAMVAAFFMHLKFDSRVFTGFFVFGLAVAAATIVSLIALFKGLW